MMAALYMLKAKTLWYVPLFVYFFSECDSFCFDLCVCPQMDQQLMFIILLPVMFIVVVQSNLYTPVFLNHYG